MRITVALSAVFFLLGLHLPYFPVWLKSRGLTPEHIGIVLGIGPWMKVFCNPLIGRWADKAGTTRTIAMLLGLGTLLAYTGLYFSKDFVTIIALCVLLGAAHSPLVPLLDAAAIRVGTGSGSYGAIRRWGSVAFIVASLLGGFLLKDYGDSVVVVALVAASAGMVLVLWLLPPRAPMPSVQEQAKSVAPLSVGELAPVLFTTSVLHGSHAMLYAFGSTHWREAGVDETTIGWLWAVGVLAEIVMFSFAHRLGALRSSGLLVLASVGGLIRWPTLAMTSSLSLLFPAQILHALSFGALHLGAMAYVQNRVRAESTTTVTALYSASSGIAVGLGFPAAGLLYNHFGGDAYYAMVAVSGVGLISAIYLVVIHRAPVVSFDA